MLFQNNAGYAARLEPDGPFVMADNIFSGNGYDWVLLEGSIFAGDNTLTAQAGLQGYELEGNVTVPANTTLTVEPGMTVRGRANIQLQVQGHLEAIGTPSQSITFTSSSDAPDGWQGLYFYTAGSTGHLRHATVRYGGDILSSNVYVQNVTDGQVIIESSQVSSVSASGIDYGLYATNSNVVISDTLFADNGDSMDDYALYSTNGSAITVTNSTFQNNAGYAARLEPDGPFVMAGGDFSGNGYNRVLLEAAAFAGDNTLHAQTGLESYELESGYLTVPASATLTVESGTTVMGRMNARLWIYGHLEAVGTPVNPITFTSSSGISNGWDGLYFYGATLDTQGTGHLRHVTARYGGDVLHSNIYVDGVSDGQVLIESSQVMSATTVSTTDYGLFASGSNVVISDTLFADNGDSTNDYALYSTANSVITVINSDFQNNAGYTARLEPDGPFLMDDNTFTGNGYDRVLLEAAAFAGDNTLRAQTGLESYELESGHVTVPASTTLTMEPGTTVIGRANARLWIYGHLEAVGTPVNPITFTSSSGISNGWDGLYFYGATLDTQGTGHLRHVTARYGGDVLHANIYVNGVSDGQVLIESSQVMSATTASATDYGLFTSGSNVVISDTLFADNGDSTNDYALYSTASSVITVTNSAFQNNAGYGLYVDASQANLTCSTVYTNGNDGVRLANSGAFSTLSSAIYDNAGMGINNAAGFTATAVHNWWGDPSGPEHTSNPGGIGDEVSDDVTFAPWLPVATCFADLMVTKSDDPDQVLAQDTLVYTMTVVNDGPGAATVVTLTDTLPDGVVYGTAVCSQGTCNEADGNIICGLGVMGSQTVATVTMWVTPTELGLITNTVTITATTYDAITANNTATETSISLFDYAAPTFTPARSGNALPGASVIYTHTLVNQANAAQSFSLAPVSTAGFTVTVEPATTEVLPFFGGSTIVTVTVQASADAVSDTVDTTTVTANGSISGTVTVTNATDTLFNGAAPSLTPNRSRSALPGESVVYTHTLVNQANAAQSFSLAPISTAGFTVTVEPATTTVLPFFDGSTVITVTVVVPPDATVGVMSTITITATGSLDGSDSVIDQITVQSGYRYIYLPLMLRNS